MVFLIALYLLATGSPLLTATLNETNGIPLGTFITWIGLLSLPTSIFLGVKQLRMPNSRFYQFLAIILKISILLAILWVPVSYLLAGNLSFSFSEKETFRGGQLAMIWFWRYAYGIVILPLGILIAHLISKGAKAFSK